MAVASLELVLREGSRDEVVAAYADLISDFGEINWPDVNVLVARRFHLEGVKRDAWCRFLEDR